jgi:chlorophyll synthase
MKILDYLFASRPMLHLPLWSVYLVCLQLHHEQTGGGFVGSHLVTLACLSLMAAGAFYVNQIFDFESDAINDKLGFLQRELTSPRGFMIGYLVLSCVATAAAGSSSRLMLLIFLQGFVFAWIYSAPPFRLKDRPLAGLMANAYCFGFVVPLTVVPTDDRCPFGSVEWLVPCYFFLTVASVHILTTLPDRPGDHTTGKRTVAVTFGPTAARLSALVFMLASLAVAWSVAYAALVYLSLFASVLILMAALFGWSRLDLMAAKTPLLLLTLLAGWYCPNYLLFIVALVIGFRIYYRRRFGVVYPKLA